METVDFYPKTFQQIDDQDNPAFGDSECLMIVAENSGKVEHPHAVVLHIIPDPIESVTIVAKFWKHDKAIDYCKTE